MRTHIISLVGESLWIARYSANQRGEVIGVAFNRDVTGFFRFEGKLKPTIAIDSKSLALKSSYNQLVVTFSDPEGTIFKFDLFEPTNYRGGSYTHKTYRHMLSSFDLYHYEVKQKECPYHYAFFPDDPEILKAARILIKDKSEIIKNLENRLQFPFGFTFSTVSQGLKVGPVLECTPAWSLGIKQNDIIQKATCDYTKTPLPELSKKLKENCNVLELLISRKSLDGSNELMIITMYRNTALEGRLFQHPEPMLERGIEK